MLSCYQLINLLTMKLFVSSLLLITLFSPALAVFGITSNEDICREKGGEVVDKYCCIPCPTPTTLLNTTDDTNCCPDTIDESITCENNDPPCYIKQNIIFNEYLFNISLLELLILGIIIILGLIFLIYVCCCFGKKKPPVPYEQIIGKYD